MRTESQRSPEERIIDRALLLALYVKSADKRALGDKLKAQKLGFLCAYPLFRERHKAFNLEFFRHDYGPMSTAIYQTWREFDELGLIPRKGDLLGRPSKAAIELAGDLWEEVLLLPQNKPVARQIAHVAQAFGHETTGHILDHVYALKAVTLENRSARPIREIEMYQHFTGVLDPKEAISVLDIDGAWLDTLGIVLIPANAQSLQTAQQDLRDGRIAAR